MLKHTCKALIIHCIDFRLANAIKEYLESNNLSGDADIVSVAGAVKNLVEPAKPEDAGFVIRQIDISKRLHNIKQIILMNHTDCGAYGGDDSLHERHLALAKQMVLKKHPGLDVKTHLIKL